MTKQVPKWYISAAHRRRIGHREVPFGIAHVRQVGGHETACGLPARDWPTFWGLPISQTVNLCPDCRAATTPTL